MFIFNHSSLGSIATSHFCHYSSL